METTPKIRIEVAQSPATTLEQLARYGKDWRESKLPPEAKGVNFSLRVQGSSFELQLLRLRGPEVLWRGSVVDAEEGGGSLVTAAAEPVPGDLKGSLLGLASAAALGVLVRGISLTFALVIVLVSLALIPILSPRLRAWYAKREAPLCRAILLRATQVMPAS